jgi:hypothetical protein
MPNYSNSVAPTSQATTIGQNVSLVIPYGNISLITGVPHKYQLEVERVFSADKNGSPVYITQLLSDAAVSIENKRNVFIIPEVDPSNTNTIYWTINEVDKEITIYTNPQTNQQNIGNRIFTANNYSIAVPPISNSNVVTIRRKTISNQPLVTWTPGNTLTSNQLNLETTQLLYLLQEVLDKVYRQISIGGDIVSQIADNSVSTSKIVDLSVTTGKINNLAITDAKLASDSVTTSKILNSNVTTAKIADYNITPAKLSNASQAWSLTGTLALTDLATSATGDKVANKNYVLDRVSKYGVITKDSTVTSNVLDTPPTIPTDANDDVSLQSGGIWFNPRDGGLRVRVLDKWVRVTGTPLNITDYISTGATAQTKTGNLTLNGDLTVDTNTLFVNSSTDRVGIGTSSPSVNLHVHQSGISSPAIQLTNGATGTTVNDGFQLQVGSSGDAYVWQRENQPLAFATNDLERMRITATGNVGIGINPSVTLDVAGRGRFLSAGAGVTSGAVTLREDASNNPAYIQWVNNDNTTNRGNIVVDNNSNMKFITGLTQKVCINSDGNVGIGKSNPSTSLDVNGIVTATGYNIQMLIPINGVTFPVAPAVSRSLSGTMTINTKSLCLFQFSFSAYRQGAGGLLTAAITTTPASTTFTAYAYSNELSSHKSSGMGCGGVTLEAGTYTVTLTCDAGTYTDSNDRAYVSVIAIPTP